MASSVTTTSSLRLLLNAEPFGFGPPAAIADIFPFLRHAFGKIGYVGKGHTLDLQRQLAYDEMHDITGLSGDAEKKELQRIFTGYDLVLTALDCEFAQIAHDAGMPVAVYDPLTWYWKNLHPVIAKCDLYIAQDFFGVKERIAAEPHHFAAPQVVPPIIPAHMPWLGKRKHILLNLGGLSNPYWSKGDTFNYARLTIEAFRQSFGRSRDGLVIAANATLADKLKDLGVKNYGREEMRVVLHKAKFAFMTPGLGNIYDAARYATPTIWLPPANDSQGMQRDMLVAARKADAALDWSDFVPGTKIDYAGEQKFVLEQITQAVSSACADADIQAKLVERMSKLGKRVRRHIVSRSTQLIYEFGWGGAKDAAELVIKLAAEKGPRA